jgi:membrane-associated protease RseP (regulator of RpoE activity)
LPQGHDVYVHPVVIASWFGLLVTMLNLIPVGQLDGGHVAHAMMGKHARFVGKLASGGLLFLSLYFSAGWLLWYFVATFFIGFNHPPVMDEAPRVSPMRWAVAWLCLLVFILCIMPVPLSQVPAP